jgi:hypothetical protein
MDFDLFTILSTMNILQKKKEVKELNASHGWVNQFKQWHSFHNYNLVEKEAVLMRLQFLNFLKY